MAAPWPIAVVALMPVSCGAVLWRMGGILRVTVVVKATFGLVHEGAARLLPPTEVLAEDHVREPMSGAIDEASDVAPYLPSTGVVMSGHAYAPGGRPTSGMAVRLAIYRDDRPLLDKTLHVFGYRAPVPNATPQPFQKIPLAWDRAFGGPSVEDNPAGCGAAASRAQPNVLDPVEVSRPAGFGPIARSWGPRRRLLNGADPALVARPSPEIPEGFDFRWFHAAPADQQIELLRGDEWIVLEGVHPALPGVTTRLPSARAEARAYLPGGAGMPVDLVADSLIIDADRQTAAVLWRGSFGVDAQLAESIPVLRVHASLEMPGHPIVWPGLEAAQAPRPAEPSAPPAPITLIDPPKPQGRPAGMTEARPAASEGALPRFFDDDDDTKGQTRAISLKGVPIPALPFRTTEPSTVASAPRMVDDALPFRPASHAAEAPAPLAETPPTFAPRPQHKSFADDDDEKTSLVDLRQIKARPVTPFATTEAGVSAASAGAPLPGAPWSAVVAPVITAPLAEETTTLDADDAVEVSADEIADELTPPTEEHRIEPQHMPAFLATPAPATPTPPPPVTSVTSSSSAVFPFSPPKVMAPPSPVAFPQSIADLPPPPPIVGARPSADLPAPPPLVAPPRTITKVPPPPIALPKPITVPPSPPPMAFSKPITAPPSPPPTPPPIVALPPPPPILDAPTIVDPAPPAAMTPAPSAPLAAPAPAEASLRDKVIAAIAAGEGVRGFDLVGADLHDVDLRRASLGSLKLRGANLKGAILVDARLGDADLSGADLSGADLSGADLSRADLSRAILVGARFDGATLTDGNFSSARGPGASFVGAIARRATFARGNWEGAVFDRLDAVGVDFTEAVIPRASFRDAHLIELKLEGTEGEAAVFDDARMPEVRAEGANLTACSFARVDAKGSIWEQATLERCRFEDAVLDDASFLAAAAAGATFARASAKNANFERLSADGADFSGVTLEDGNLRQAHLHDATLTGANLRGVSANRADLTRACLLRADLDCAVFRAGKLTAALLAHAILEGADLRDADLERANLFSAQRKTAKLNGANMKDIVEVDPEA